MMDAFGITEEQLATVLRSGTRLTPVRSEALSRAHRR